MISSKIKNLVITILKGLIAFILIYWLVQSDKLNIQSLKTLLDPKVFSLCLFFLGLNLFFCSERWYQILNSQEVHTTRIQALKMTLVGVFFNFVVPGGVGGDVVKGYYIAKDHPQERLRAVVTVAMDRLIGLYTMILMAVFVMIIDLEKIHEHPQLATIFYLLALGALVFSVFWMIIFSKRLSQMNMIHKLLNKLPYGEKFQKMFYSFSHYSKSKHIIFKTFFISLIAQVFWILIFVTTGYFLGFQDVAIRTYFYVVPVGGMVMAVPISPAGVGVGQAAFYYLFNLVIGYESNVGTMTITSFQIFLLIYGLVGSIFYVFMGKKKTNEL